MDKYARINDKLKIYDVISHYVKLTKKGNNWIGLCNFHSDTNPSLTVSESKKIFKCFACGKSGNAISFIMAADAIPFVQALKKACELSGINQEDYPDWIKVDHQHQRYFQLTAFLTQQYQKFLEDERHQAVRDYLKNTRKLSDIQIDKYQIGYAPRIFGPDLIAHLIKSSNELEHTNYVINDAQILKLTELQANSATWKDLFLDRIIFPIHNEQAQVVGYSGRICNDRSGPKYLNSAESVIFKKQNVLYNFHRLLQLPHFDQIYLVEGFIDVIALDQIGIFNAVASMGTAFSLHQIKLLHQYFTARKKGLVLGFDHDPAGQKFMISTAKKLLAMDFEVTAINFWNLTGNFKDLDQIIQDNNPNNLALISQPVNYFEWWYQYLVTNQLVHDYDQIRSCVQEYLKIFFRFNNLKPIAIKVNLSTEYLITSIKILFRTFELLNNPQITENMQQTQTILINFIYQNNQYDPHKNSLLKFGSKHNQSITTPFESLTPSKQLPPLTDQPWLVLLNKIVNWSANKSLQADWWQAIDAYRQNKLKLNFAFLLRTLIWHQDLLVQLNQWLNDHPDEAEIIDHDYDHQFIHAKILDQSLRWIINLPAKNLFSQINRNDHRLIIFDQISNIFNEWLDEPTKTFWLSLFDQYYLDHRFQPSLQVLVTTMIIIKKMINEISIDQNTNGDFVQLLDLRNKLHQQTKKTKTKGNK